MRRLNKYTKQAGVAQLVEQLICNQQVGGSSPSTSSNFLLKIELNMGVFPSGQRGQTVNLLLFSFDGSNPSSPTSKKSISLLMDFLLIQTLWISMQS